jgi:hypothetical protein
MKKTPLLAVVLSGLLVLVSCNTVSKDAQKSSTRLIVTSVLGTTADGQSAAFLESDVRLYDGTVAADAAQITLMASLIDPDPVNPPSTYNDITLTSFSVSYTLPNGTGTPGVDVPMPIENSLSTIYIQVDKSITVPFIVVQAIAKQAAPLVALAGTGNSIQVNALITFEGQDGVGRKVSASGSLPITFADYLDLPPADAPVKR